MRTWLLWLLPGGLLTAALAAEVQTSWLQARIFPRLASELTFEVAPGPSDSIVFPGSGPHDLRNGYSQLPAFTAALRDRGFVISHQTRFSEHLVAYSRRGGNPPYEEKIQTGLTLLDDDDIPLFRARFPERVYPVFDSIPPLLVSTLLYIENRELLGQRPGHHNPAVEWDRLAQALVRQGTHLVLPEGPAPGASTLATQLEKFRHSPGGLTTDALEKLRQMVSASVRAYRSGPDTREATRLIVRDYLNSTPLAGRAGYGEIQGIGDGLWVWFGIDFPEANRALQAPAADVPLTQQARVYKSTLALLLAQRRPSHLLLAGREELARLTDSHLRLLARAGIIDNPLRDAALAQPLQFRDRMPTPPVPAFIDQKAVNSIRTELLANLGVDNLYALDRLDLTVKTTVASGIQEEVTRVLRRLKDPDFARENGLIGERLLREDQLGSVDFSVLLYETTPRGNLLRVQTDNLDRPFDMNDSSKLDLGSTAKLRTLVTYLEIVEQLYQRHHHLPRDELPVASAADPIRRWLLEWLAQNPDGTLGDALDAALVRRYSAHTGERFFTAGGVHYFNNFDRKDNHRMMTVAEAFNRSVNLVFIRLMRDIVRFHIAETPHARDLLTDPDHPLRDTYLRRFADMEGKSFLRQFFRLYRGLDSEARLTTLAQRTKPAPYRLAMAFRAVRPEADVDDLGHFMAARLGAGEMPPEREIGDLFAQYDPARFNSNDQAYLAGIHPLELWLLGFLDKHPEAPIGEVLAASADERQTAYNWLFKTRRWSAQQNRLRILLEQEAFAAIHAQWQRLGYPFPSLVPSYATALGVSADRPTALAELMGIIVNDGVKLPVAQIDNLVFAAGTPYETALRFEPRHSEQVLSPAIAGAVRQALAGIVESGTARRLNGVFRDQEGQPLLVGGKTGTGDHRSKRFASGGRLIETEVVNRNAIFTFFIGDRYFGAIVAHVGGPRAREFDFTSGLAAQLLKTLAPALQTLPVDSSGLASAATSPGAPPHP